MSLSLEQVEAYLFENGYESALTALQKDARAGDKRKRADTSSPDISDADSESSRESLSATPEATAPPAKKAKLVTPPSESDSDTDSDSEDEDSSDSDGDDESSEDSSSEDSESGSEEEEEVMDTTEPVPAMAAADDTSSSDSSISADDSDDSSSSSSDEVAEAAQLPNGVASDDSSDSDNGSSDDESDSEESGSSPGVSSEEESVESGAEDADESSVASSVAGAGTAIKASKAEGSDDDSSSSDSEDAESAEEADAADDDSDVSDSDSSSDSDESNAAGSSSEDEDSETSSDSSSDESDVPVKQEKVQPVATTVKQAKKNKTAGKVEPEVASASSSATLAGASPEPVTQPTSAEVSSGESGMHPSRLARMDIASAPSTAVTAAAAAKIKKEGHVPFSRIPANQAVDPKFASNQYVPYDYAEKAHQDLIVTRGKGFTKEKNKKKRGSYRGGAIDFAPKGIKFDD